MRIAVKVHVTTILWSKDIIYSILFLFDLLIILCNHFRSFLLVHNNSGKLIVEVSLNN